MNRITAQIFILLLVCIKSFAQQIPNNSFENWSGGQPNSWNTSNQSIPLLGTITTVSMEASDPQQGAAAAKLTTVKIAIPFGSTYKIPALLTLGKLNLDLINQTASLSGGFPFSGKPEKLAGYFKYQPVNNDKCIIGLGLFRWNNGTSDTIGYGVVDTFGTINSWTRFEVPVYYLKEGTPDTLNIIILNSNPLDGADHTGTVMWIDNLSFEYGTVGIEGIAHDKGIKIYAEPYTRHLILEFISDKQENMDISLFNIAGVETNHWKLSVQQSTEHLDVGNLLPGTYVIRISAGNRLIDTRKITILN